MKKLAIIVAITMIPILCAAAVVGFVYFSYREIPVTEDDRRLIVSASDIAHLYDDFEPKKEFEKLTKIRYLDGSEELEYEYDSPSDDEPYISVTVSREKSESDAKAVFFAQWAGSKLVAKAIGVEIVENNDFYSPGDTSNFADFKNEFGVVGHMLIVRKGNDIYSYMISGFIITNADDWHSLFDPKIDLL